MSILLAEPITENEAADLTDVVLIRYVSAIWADPDLRAVLREHRYFVVERMRSFGRYGYLTPQERQGLSKVLFAGSEPVQGRILHVQRRRAESVEGLEEPGS